MRYFLSFLWFCALSLTQVRAADSNVVFNEVQYNPIVGQTEWVELHNLNGVDVNIAGWTLTGGINYTFPTSGAGSVILGNSYLIIAAVPAQIAGSLGPFTGLLSNVGETLRIRNLNGRIMDELSYSSSGDWPIGANGSGATLSRRDETKVNTGPTAWLASTALGGTPGGANFMTSLPITRSHITLGDTWKYRDADAAPPVDWKDPGYVDTAWSAGKASFGAEVVVSNLTVTTNLVARYRAGAITGLADGAVVSTWADTATSDGVSQNGSAGTTTPTYRTSSTPNGKPAVRFDSNDECRTSLPPGILGTSGFTYFILLKGNDYQTDGSYLFDRNGVGNSLISLKSSFGRYQFEKRYADGTGLGGPVSTSNISNPTQNPAWQRVAVRRNRTLNQFEIWVNGEKQATEADTGESIVPEPINIGAHSQTVVNSAQPRGFNGDIAELLIYKDELSEGDFQSVGSYLNSEYGLRVLTPLSTTAPVCYFRKSFTFSGDPARTSLRLKHTVADGAVFYLNGTEIRRTNLPAGPLGHTTAALSLLSPPTIFGNVLVPNSALVNGVNVLSVSLHKAAGSPTTYFDATLESEELPSDPAVPAALQLSEISGASDPNFYIELRNNSIASLNLSGWTLRTSLGQSVVLPASAVAAGGYFTLNAAALGFIPAVGSQCFLLPPGGTTLGDAREVTNRPRGLVEGNRWGHPTTPTPGAANVAVVSSAVVINEIFYKAINSGPEQWIELYNKSAATVDLSGWKFSEGVNYTFPPATSLAAGGYLVVAWDPTAFSILHPTANALGPWSGNLSGRGETILLRDASDNVTDEVRYYNDGRWSQWADGGGSSLELRDPRSDNSRGEAWAPSDESAQTGWQNISYSGLGTNPSSSDPTTWNEFVFGLLDSGEFLIDDLSVKFGAGGTQLIQNGTFSSGAATAWRIIGNHVGTVVDDPFLAGSKVLKVSASGATEHMHNQATTTLKSGGSFHTLSAANTYTISFRAKWLRGDNRLHTRLYVNRLARQTMLSVPLTGGTPGAVNRSAIANAGPTFNALSHAPAVPISLDSQASTVSVFAADPDGIASLNLFTSVNGAAFINNPMVDVGGGRYAAIINPKAEGTRVQYYVQATDLLGAVSVCPAAGPASRAMVQWGDRKAILQMPSGARPHNLRILLTGADANSLYRLENVMSNAALPCTVILDEREVYHGTSVRLKGSEHARNREDRVGFNLQFPPEALFLGLHGSVSVDRSGGDGGGQGEILLKTASNAAGGMNSPEDDLIRVIAPVATSTSPIGNGFTFSGTTLTGPAILSKTRFDGTYLDGQWQNGSNGPVFKYERIYVLTQTINPATRVIDTSIQPENPKIPQSITAPPGVEVTNLGANKENYRWYWLIENARGTDDYQKIIDAASAIGQIAGSPEFKTQTEQLLDVSALLRAHVPATLYGVQDNYLNDVAQHNVLFYFPPGGKGILFPWDQDYLSQVDPTSSLTGGQDLGKFITDPTNKRLYYGHLLDILNRSFNDAFLTRWATHYSRFGIVDQVGTLPYLRQRAAFARSVVTGQGGQTAPIPSVAFARTSPATLNVNTPFATISGDGWIDIDQIRLSDSLAPLAVTWIDENSWTLQLPLFTGTRLYTLEALRSNGTSVGTATVTVTTTNGITSAAASNLVISKIHYHPTNPTPSEITSGYASPDDFEFLELQNISATLLDLSNCRFDTGITYAFAANSTLPAGGRLVIPRRSTAFALRHPGVPTAPEYYLGSDPNGNKLSDGGEEIGLLSAAGADIKRFTYDDAAPWPVAADGTGAALTLISPSGNPDHRAPLNWRASALTDGSPNTTEGTSFTGNANADSDQDGLTDLVEFALGTGSPPFVQMAGPSGSPVITFTLERDTAARVTTTVQQSSDLSATAPGGWTTATAATLLSRTPLTGSVERLIYTLPTAPGTTRLFLRAHFSSP